MRDAIPASITTTDPARGDDGQLAHPQAVEHLQRLGRHLYPVGEHAWCLVGNGLSNQTFIRAPEGIIAIDTGESVEEMRAAITALRTQTSEPIVACIYSHFHYVNGTTAILENPRSAGLQIYGHPGIAANLRRFGGEIAPRAGRGLVRQFGVALPDQGPDALLHCGLGLFYRNPDHAPYTSGHIPAQHQIGEPTTCRIAGLAAVITPAPSDSDDSLTIWFPELSICVNNLVWPSLFNIYAIRGEPYRDPQILLRGIDEIHAYRPTHLIGTHGPPVTGEQVEPAIRDFRDAIQYIWDQTVRGINRGLSLSELTQAVQLPRYFERSYFTSQLYGLVEHHVRQIHNGLFGWLDEADQHLFPLPDQERYKRLIRGFGGRAKVRREMRTALEEQDWRWALELGSWLTGTRGASTADRSGVAQAMRAIAQHTPSANVRNWCLTRALELEGQIDLSRFYQHRFAAREVLAAAPTRFVPVLRVLLDPQLAHGLDVEVAWHFAGGERCGLRLRNAVAVPTNGSNADISIGLSHETWAEILGGKRLLSQAIEEGIVSVAGSERQLMQFFAAFEHQGLR